MSNSQNKKNEQQNNLCTTLTEKRKKGELEAGWYYVLLFSNEEYITFIDGNWVVDDRLIGAEIKEVLAPVPSYEEWQKVLNIDFNNEVLRLENAKLKELLKECRDAWVIYKPYDRNQLCKRIDNAIGEKK